jgi:hypothetical protein
MQEEDYLEYYDSEESSEYKIDTYFLEAQRKIRELFEGDKKAVFYMRQLQVKFEKEFFHWITANAINGLVKAGYLKQIDMSISASGNPLHLHFFTSKSTRYAKRKANALSKVVQEYSQDHITASCGNRAEILFAEDFAGRGFVIKGKKVLEYNGKKWEETKNDLDYVFERDGIPYGCEIKNTLDYIGREELEIKLRMCKHFGVRPLFIMRYAPKTYADMIIKEGGFALLFKAQIYDLSQRDLVESIRNDLGYEADCPKAIPSGIIDRFEIWHNRHKNS